MRRATEAQRQRLHETFEALCRIESRSGQERRCADWVAEALREIGLEPHEDDAGARAGSDSGNLLTRVRGAHDASILLCAHLDTVPPVAPIEPVLVNGGWENQNEGILGADNKAAVAVMLELARSLTEASELPPVGLELPWL